jgi:hypothetical protein
MMEENLKAQHSLSHVSARNLSHTTKSVPMMEELTPQWLLKLLPWVGVEAGVYRVNKKVACSHHEGEHLFAGHMGEHNKPHAYPDYHESPRNYPLALIQTILRINTQITDIFNKPINQFEEQKRLTIEAMKERQEWEIINNKDFGLVHSVAPGMKIKTRKGAPTPDDMDELLARVWKKPAFFLAHPKAVAAFGRECTRRGVPPATVNIYGSPFITWRGIPIIPCDKMPIDDGKTKVLLMRLGEPEQGVVGLHQPGIPNEIHMPSLSMKFAGIDNLGISSYIMSLYFSVAVLTDDALGMLDDVEVGRFHEYE